MNYPKPGGRLGIIQLLKAIIFKVPVEFLKTQTVIMFIPLIHCLTNDSESEVKYKICSVTSFLISRSDPLLIFPLLVRWMKHCDNSFKFTGVQACIPYIHSVLRLTKKKLSTL